VSKWEFVAKTIRRWIKRKQFEPGDALPSQDDLSEYFGCSRETIRRALLDLEYNGYIVLNQGAKAKVK